LTQHGNFSKHSLTYFDIEKNQHVIPYVVEPSVGCDRLLYALFIEHYDIEKLKNDETREVLHLPVALCPYKIAILPLANKLNSQAKRIYLKLLEKGISCNFDTSGSIGKRYRRQDAIGTMYCLTYDFESTKNKTFTIRNRDTMRQKRLSFDQLMSFLEKNL
jgi:glycyl-tRNA synthetase